MIYLYIMSVCNCTKADGKRCTRQASTKVGHNSLYCWQHQVCIKPYGLPPSIPIPVSPEHKDDESLPDPVLLPSASDYKETQSETNLDEMFEDELQELRKKTFLLEREFKDVSLDDVKKLNKKIHSNGSKMHEITQSVIDFKSESGELGDAFMNHLPKLEQKAFLNVILKYLLHNGNDLRRGDIVWIEAFGNYMNDGKFIFSGLILEDLDNDIDEYGSVPSNYEVISEFPITYWQKVIAS